MEGDKVVMGGSPSPPPLGKTLIISIKKTDYFPPAEFMKEAGNVFSHLN